MKKILLIPPLNGWYLENYCEYLIRYLSNEFFIEVADVPYPPYENFINRFPETHPLQRNPDDYDLIVPLLATHWVVTDKQKYIHKTALIWYQPNEGSYFPGLAGIAATTPLARKSLFNAECYKTDVRFGIDTEFFKPLNFENKSKLLRLGMVGNLYNPRRMTSLVMDVVEEMEGVELKLYVNQRPKTEHDLELIGGRRALKYIVSGEKSYAGLPNIYNQLDVLIRCESDPGYSFPVLEAGACGVPVIATDSGIDHEVTNAGGGILIKGDREKYLNDEAYVKRELKKAIIFMRDNPKERAWMGLRAESFIKNIYKWEHHIDDWRRFFRKVLVRVYEGGKV